MHVLRVSFLSFIMPPEMASRVHLGYTMAVRIRFGGGHAGSASVHRPFTSFLVKGNPAALQVAMAV